MVKDDGIHVHHHLLLNVLSINVCTSFYGCGMLGEFELSFSMHLLIYTFIFYEHMHKFHTLDTTCASELHLYR
jgi:hypothetical protein